MLDILLLPVLVREEQGSGVVVRGGGSAANSAAWCAATGEPATFVGCVGDDAVGGLLIDQLERAGVTCLVRRVAGAESGCVAIEITPGGERVMRSSRGANQALRATDVRRFAADGPAVAHVTGYSLLGAGGEAALEAAAEHSHVAGGLLSFDPSSTGVIETVGAGPMLDLAQRAGVDVLLPNTNEATALTGEPDAVEAARVLGGRVPAVIVKNGANPVAFCTGGVYGTVPTTPLTPLDTTGAGDAFNAGVICGLAAGMSAADACTVGHRLAAQAICRYGGRPDQ